MQQKIKEKVYNLLRRSEKYAKTDMVYLTKGGFWLTLGQVVSTAASFLLAIAFANLLPKETYGVYRYVLSILGILAISALQGVETSLVRAVAQGNDGSLITGIKTKIRWSLLGSLASVFIAGYYYLNHNPELTISFLIVAAFLPFMDSFGTYSSYLTGKKLFNVSTKYFIISQIISAVSIFIAVFFTKNIFLILLAYLAPWTIMRYIFLKITLKKFVTNQNQDPKMISYGKHLTLMNIINIIASQMDKLLVFHYLGAVQLAVYSFAIAMPEQIKALLKGLNLLALPKFSERTKEEIKSTMLGKDIRLTITISIVIIIYILAAPLLFKIFFPQYMDSVLYSQIFSISLIAGGVGTFPKIILQARKAQRELYLQNTIVSIAEIVLLLILLYFYGLMGLIIARIATRLFSSGITYWLAERNLSSSA